jgi:carboxyl-terminal processing protease
MDEIDSDIRIKRLKNSIRRDHNVVGLFMQSLQGNSMRRITQTALSLGLAVIMTGLATSNVSLGEELKRVLDASGPSQRDRLIARSIARGVDLYHVSSELSDEVSGRALKQFLRYLDPMKIYFLESDVAEWTEYNDQIDDMLKSGSLEFAYTVYNRFAERMDAAMPKIQEMVDMQHDFTLDETITVDVDSLDPPKTFEEAMDRARRQIKYNLLVLKESEESLDEAKEKLHRRYRMQERNAKQTDVFELLEYFISAITTAMDPHTTYMAPRRKANFDITIGLNLSGIGAQLSPDDGYTKVASVVPGGAADKDGQLESGDRIVAVRQDDQPEPIDVVEMKLDDVVSLIRGRPGTVVHLTVEKDESKEIEIYSITRAKVELKDEEARSAILERGQKPNGEKYKIGYIDLPSFYMDMAGARAGKPNYRSTTRDVRALLKEFEEQNVDGVVIDLVRNGGGSLIEAISMTGLFIDTGPVVQVKDEQGRISPYDDEESGAAWTGPLVVLTSKMSASASEIFAGAIKDYNRGIVVGDPNTHGKGTVQTLLDVQQDLMRGTRSGELGALKLTIQQFYLPDGQSTQLDGVAADVILPSITSHRDIGESDLDFALPTDKIPGQPHVDYRMANSSIKADLQRASAKRIAESKDFEKILKRIELYVAQKEEKTVSLNEETFRTRMDQFEEETDEAEEELTDEEKKAKRTAVYFESPYNEEVLNVAIDYVNALRELNLASAG